MVKKGFSMLVGLVLFVFPALLLISSILAPYFESRRMEAASLLYSFLSNFCHQKPSRSLWIFGSPMGIDSRCFALYASFLLTGLRLSTYQSRINWKSGLLFLIPILIDGFTQLFGLRESTNVLRLLTGALGGVGLGLLVYPFYYKVLKGFSDPSKLVFLWPGMKRAISFALVISLFGLSLSPLSSSYAQAPKKRTVVLKEGTTLAVKAMETVTSETAKRGQQIRFEVVRDVTVDDVVVIKSGATVVGEVIHAASSKAIGREGELVVNISYAKAVDGTNVPLRTSLTEKGEEKLTTTVVLGVIICPLFLLMKGGEAAIHAGTEHKVFVDRDTKIEIAAGPQSYFPYPESPQIM